MKVIWSKFAEQNLDLIYEYYSSHATHKVASMILHGIIDSGNSLEKNPYIGK